MLGSFETGTPEPDINDPDFLSSMGAKLVSGARLIKRQEEAEKVQISTAVVNIFFTMAFFLLALLVSRGLLLKRLISRTQAVVSVLIITVVSISALLLSLYWLGLSLWIGFEGVAFVLIVMKVILPRCESSAFEAEN